MYIHTYIYKCSRFKNDRNERDWLYPILRNPYVREPRGCRDKARAALIGSTRGEQPSKRHVTCGPSCTSELVLATQTLKAAVLHRKLQDRMARLVAVSSQCQEGPNCRMNVITRNGRAHADPRKQQKINDEMHHLASLLCALGEKRGTLPHGGFRLMRVTVGEFVSVLVEHAPLVMGKVLEIEHVG